MRMRKGQTAMEYLMTYGWAILIIMVVLAVLFYLGVLNPPIPAQCIFQSAGLSCISSKLSSNNGKLTLRIGEATGHPIQVNGIVCTLNTSSSFITSNNVTYNPAVTTVIKMNPGDQYTVADPTSANTGVNNVNCTAADNTQLGAQTLGTTYINGRIYVNYTETDTGINRIATAVYTARYEA